MKLLDLTVLTTHDYICDVIMTQEVEPLHLLLKNKTKRDIVRLQNALCVGYERAYKSQGFKACIQLITLVLKVVSWRVWKKLL